MGSSFSLGIDFGSLGVRAAAVLEDRVITLPMLYEGDYLAGAVTFNPADIGEKQGFQFSSVKHSIERQKAVNSLLGSFLPGDLVHDFLKNLKQLAERYVGGSIGETMIAVPATYPESRRAALLRLSAEAGIANVRLINDAIAAAIDFSLQQPKDALYFIVDGGYHQCEIALVRKADHQFQALGYGRFERPCGRFLDLSILFGCVRAMEELGLGKLLQQFQPQQWLHLQQIIQHTKERLNRYVDVHLTIRVGNDKEESFLIPLNRALFETHIEGMLQENLKHFQQTLKSAGVKKKDVSAVILAGGTTSIDAFQKWLIKQFPRTPLHRITQDGVARGAAAFAANLMGIREEESVVVKFSQAETESFAQVGTDFLPLNVVRTPSIKTALKTKRSESSPLEIVPEPTRSPSVNESTNLDTLWGYVSSLARDNAVAAKAFLNRLKEQADEQLKVISEQAEAMNWRIKKAYQFLEKGKLEEAVQHSHRAQASNPGNARVFEDMIEIHIQAAQRSQTVEGYKNAIRWLECARAHDQGNLEIWELIAERHYLHARQLYKKGEPAEALKAVSRCLKMKPTHKEALKLEIELKPKKEPSSTASSGEKPG